MSDISQSDLNAAARGLQMSGKSIVELKEIVTAHKDSSMFASRVIVLSAEQMIAAKRRVRSGEGGIK